MKFLSKIPIELIFFIVALFLLYNLDLTKNHASLCPLALLKFDFCPGCGLGKSLNLLMHGHFSQSIKMHPLGFFAFFVIIWRVYTLSIKKCFKISF